MTEDFDTWYADLRPAMGVALAAWCGDASVAADALDESFARAIERWDRVRRLDSPAGWVWRTATNIVRRRERRHAMEARLLRRQSSPDAGAPDRVEDDLDLRQALRALTERQRTAVVLYYVADLPVAEVALAMGVADGTVTATLHQARQRLNDALVPAPSGAPVTVTSEGMDP